MKGPKPKIAIVSPNCLIAIGMKQVLQSVMPGVDVEVFDSVESLENAGLNSFYHFFVDMGVLLAKWSFFSNYKHRTIVLTTSPEHSTQMKDFHCVCVGVSEQQLVRQLLMLMHEGHKRMHKMKTETKGKNILTVREIEVLSLVVQGLINKEIADRLNISLATVVTHRRNITEKLGVRSVSALTIYAVMNGYVGMDKI